MSKRPYLMVGNVLHNGKELRKGAICPPELSEEMASKGLASPVPEAAKPSAPAFDPAQASKEQLAKEQAEADAKAKAEADEAAAAQSAAAKAANRKG